MGCRDEFEDPGCDPEINSAHHPALVINAGANVAQRVTGPGYDITISLH